jgi:decaprenylphospho-beta-D-ribofuranose 2-oxidase
MPEASRTRLSGWGQVAPAWSTVVTARDDEQVAGIITSAGPRGVVARGLGRGYGDAAQLNTGVVLAPIRPDAPIELDSDGATARVSGGTTLDRLMRELLPRGFHVPVLPGTRHVTIGGAIAADIHGKNHHADGSFTRYVRELTLIDGLGNTHVLCRDGGDAQAFWATAGGIGLTGVVVSAVLELRPVTSTLMRTTTSRFRDLDAVLDAMERSTARHHVAWIDAASGRGFGRSILDEGEHDDRSDATREFAPRRPIVAPPLPVNVVRPWVTQAFNTAWWQRARERRDALVPMTTFFHPLDAVDRWPRLYGPAGFLQWQIAVPFEARPLLEQSLRTLHAANLTPTLVILKRFGESSPGHLSFPIAGWTLAVDLAASHPRLYGVLDGLDAQVTDAGGRVYLAKDVRANAATVARMYPRLDEWREVRDRLDPEHRFRSDLSERLALT